MLQEKLRGVAPGPDAFPLVLTSVSLIVISILSVHESAFSLQKWPTRKLAHREEMLWSFLVLSRRTFHVESQWITKEPTTLRSAPENKRNGHGRGTETSLGHAEVLGWI